MWLVGNAVDLICVHRFVKINCYLETGLFQQKKELEYTSEQ